MTTDQPITFFDGHNDTLLNLYARERGRGRSFFEQSDYGHIDLPRAKQAGLGGGIFAILAPSNKRPHKTVDYLTEDGYHFPMPEPMPLSEAQAHTHAMMSRMFRIERLSEGHVKVARTVAEIEACLAGGVLAAVVHFEGADAIDPDLHALEVYHQAGLRSLGLVWSRKTPFAQGVPIKFPSTPDFGPGLTDAGKALVRACNQLGIMLDLSHLNAAGFWDVAQLSQAPLVATHSNAHALCPIGRNLTDKQLDAIRESEGIVGVNFGTGFLRKDGMWTTDTPLEDVMRHIDYLVERLGVDCVGMGSDFDGATIPAAIGDVRGLKTLFAALGDRGYDRPTLEKLGRENWLRVLRQTLK